MLDSNDKNIEIHLDLENMNSPSDGGGPQHPKSKKSEPFDLEKETS